MAIALDCSVALAWCFRDERNTAAERVLDQVATEGGLVPTLWWFELWNALLVGERRSRITQDDTAIFLALVERLPIDVDASPMADEVLALARRFGLSAYDAAYLELAHRRSAPLATRDKALASSARKLGIAVL
jgi:predicted nucleic acid-binding protein